MTVLVPATRAIVAALLLRSEAIPQSPVRSADHCPEPDNPSSIVGFYHWGGQQPGDFSKGFDHLRDLKARVARFTLSARMDLDYKIGTTCINGYSLPAILERPDVRRAISESELRVAVLTAYDGVGFDDCATSKHLSLAFYTYENVNRMIQEYSDFVYRLRQLNRGTAKRIIISNWEGDNAVYCGSAFNYVFSTQFRVSCNENYASQYLGNRGPNETMAAMTLWHRARFSGVADGNARADAEGIDSIHILVAPEISSVRLLRENGFMSVLRDVVPNIRYDYISYSSYESVNTNDPATSLRNDLAIIRAVVGDRGIILGEVGFSRSRTADVVERTRIVLNAALSVGVAYVIHWNLHDQAANDFGMYDAADELTNVGRFYQALLLNSRGASRACGRSPRSSNNRTEPD